MDRMRCLERGRFTLTADFRRHVFTDARCCVREIPLPGLRSSPNIAPPQCCRRETFFAWMAWAIWLSRCIDGADKRYSRPHRVGDLSKQHPFDCRGDGCGAAAYVYLSKHQGEARLFLGAL